ncbi:MAG: hypothetical protein HDT30_07430 [Clostridiales bacterium]|nr:hypothetical protein [Clostridiales bacterium]
MTFVETYYLIDFENVHEDGLSGSENLSNHDHVYLFSTKNAPKISIEKLASFNSADLSSHEIPVGNQSLDMHLVSYLGYLIGKNINSKCKYIIISKDTDYDNIIAFWKSHSDFDITRQDKIINSVQRKAQSKATIATKTNNKITDISNNKIQLNTKVQREIRNAGYHQATINKVASIVVKHYGENKFANNVHNELKKNYPDYSELYKIVKPIIAQYSPKTTVPPSKTKINNKIQKILSKANFNNDVITYVVSLASNHQNEKNIKQTIYRSIVAKYGQNQGLNIYNHIKKIF